MKKTLRVEGSAKYTKNNPRVTITLEITSNHRDEINITVSELFM